MSHHALLRSLVAHMVGRERAPGTTGGCVAREGVRLQHLSSALASLTPRCVDTVVVVMDGFIFMAIVPPRRHGMSCHRTRLMCMIVGKGKGRAAATPPR